jgi:uncharacterized protein
MNEKAGLMATWLCLLVVIGVALRCALPAASAENQSVDKPSGMASVDAPFKGKWAGPDPRKIKLPGPGPAKGQSLPDYFAHLKTGPRSPHRYHVLVLGGTRGFHHDSVSAAMNMIYQQGRRTGMWDAELVTDFALLADKGGEEMNAGFQPKGLKDFDAVVVASASGDWNLESTQKAAFVRFVREYGKGLVVIHAGLDANHTWRDYIDMIGGEMTGHPFNTVDDVLVKFPLVNEDTHFPPVSHLPLHFSKQDELYVIKNWSRDDVDVVLRLDESKLDLEAHDGLIPPDHDMPVAWAKRYGKGRVFASSIGHSIEAFDDPEVQRMYSEAVKWVLALTDAEITPHSRPTP